MLVVKRKPRETIKIGPDIVVTVTKVSTVCKRCGLAHSGDAYIGIDAPKDIGIVRGELLAAE
jgi:carbon storage regulator CsrA